VLTKSSITLKNSDILTKNDKSIGCGRESHEYVQKSTNKRNDIKLWTGQARHLPLGLYVT